MPRPIAQPLTGENDDGKQHGKHGNRIIRTSMSTEPKQEHLGSETPTPQAESLPTRQAEFGWNPAHPIGTCMKCGEEMVYNVPRMGPGGGFVHKLSGSFACHQSEIAREAIVFPEEKQDL